MSYRARRVAEGRPVQSFDWTAAAQGPHDGTSFVALCDEPLSIEATPAADESRAPEVEPAAAAEPEVDVQARAAAIEREAFAQGYAAGERSGAEAGAQRADALIRRLSATLDEVANLRRTMAARAERDLVQLALAVARRIVHREIEMDHDLVAALAHVALERLDAHRGPAVIKMHPDDVARLNQEVKCAWDGSAIRLVADASLARGGCVVETPHGRVETALDQQLHEVAQGLLGSEPEPDLESRTAA